MSSTNSTIYCVRFIHLIDWPLDCFATGLLSSYISTIMPELYCWSMDLIINNCSPTQDIFKKPIPGRVHSEPYMPNTR